MLHVFHVGMKGGCMSEEILIILTVLLLIVAIATLVVDIMR